MHLVVIIASRRGAAWNIGHAIMQRIRAGGEVPAAAVQPWSCLPRAPHRRIIPRSPVAE
jgi:hypothetical protein